MGGGAAGLQVRSSLKRVFVRHRPARPHCPASALHALFLILAERSAEPSGRATALLFLSREGMIAKPRLACTYGASSSLLPPPPPSSFKKIMATNACALTTRETPMRVP